MRPNPSLEELLAFERLLSDLSARFANVAGDRVVEELEGVLKRILEFLDFDRCAFWEFVGEEQYFLCSVAVEGVSRRRVAQYQHSLVGLPGSFAPDVLSLFDRATMG